MARIAAEVKVEPPGLHHAALVRILLVRVAVVLEAFVHTLQRLALLWREAGRSGGALAARCRGPHARYVCWEHFVPWRRARLLERGHLEHVAAVRDQQVVGLLD